MGLTFSFHFLLYRSPPITMPPKKKKGFYKQLNLGEDYRIAVTLKLQDFRKNEDEKGGILNQFSNTTRKIIWENSFIFNFYFCFDRRVRVSQFADLRGAMLRPPAGPGAGPQVQESRQGRRTLPDGVQARGVHYHAVRCRPRPVSALAQVRPRPAQPVPGH